MKIFELTKEDKANLKPFQLKRGITAGEAAFYYKPNDNSKIIKEYYFDVDLDQKKDTLLELDSNKSKINVPGLVLADELCLYHDDFLGPIFPIIPGRNASVYLKSSYYPLKVKIEILKQIGTILQNIANTPKELNLAFGDVHADNFIVNGINYSKKDDVSGIKTYAIDTDGMTIKNHTEMPNFYLSYGPIINVPKYETFKCEIRVKRIVPSKSTDIFCFIMMLLEVISGERDMQQMPIVDFKYYLDYLDTLGFDSRLLASFASVYEPDKDNISPLPYLDTLTQISEKSSLNSFFSFKH